MIEMTGVESKIEGLIQVLREGDDASWKSAAAAR